MKELLRAKEVAVILTVSVRTVYALIESKQLPIVKLGPKSTRIRRADVEHLIANGVK